MLITMLSDDYYLQSCDGLNRKIWAKLYFTSRSAWRLNLNKPANCLTTQSPCGLTVHSYVLPVTAVAASSPSASYSVHFVRSKFTVLVQCSR